jgi:hypothetical protein
MAVLARKQRWRTIAAAFSRRNLAGNIGRMSIQTKISFSDKSAQVIPAFTPHEDFKNQKHRKFKCKNFAQFPQLNKKKLTKAKKIKTLQKCVNLEWSRCFDREFPISEFHSPFCSRFSICALNLLWTPTAAVFSKSNSRFAFCIATLARQRACKQRVARFSAS